MKINSYKDLTVWQKSIELVKLIYQLTKQLPRSEEYGLIIQMRRAAIAIASNIAEGFGRRNIKEYIQFLYISVASCFELETQLIITEQNYNLDVSETMSILNEIIRMLYSLISKLKPKT